MFAKRGLQKPRREAFARAGPPGHRPGTPPPGHGGPPLPRRRGRAPAAPRALPGGDARPVRACGSGMEPAAGPEAATLVAGGEGGGRRRLRRRRRSVSSAGRRLAEGTSLRGSDRRWGSGGRPAGRGARPRLPAPRGRLGGGAGGVCGGAISVLSQRGEGREGQRRWAVGAGGTPRRSPGSAAGLRLQSGGGEPFPARKVVGAGAGEAGGGRARGQS